VVFIGQNCFEKCSALARVVFDNDSMVCVIEEGAFRETALTAVRLPRSVAFVPDTTFDSRTAVSQDE
jgi:hypothetical protein